MKKINQIDQNGRKQGYWEEPILDATQKYSSYIKGVSKGVYVDSAKEGLWKTFDNKGEVVEEGEYSLNKKIGVWRKYGPGRIRSEGLYSDDMKEGIWTYFFYDDNLGRGDLNRIDKKVFKKNRPVGVQEVIMNIQGDYKIVDLELKRKGNIIHNISNLIPYWRLMGILCGTVSLHI